MRTYQQQLHENHLEHVATVAERIADFVARAWRELVAPPRPAWLIVATRSERRRGEVSHLFAPR